MVSKIYSAALEGLSAQIIEIEVVATKGLRAFNIVGLADTAIKEAKERVGAAIRSINLSPPHHQVKRVLVNLAPADLKKEGSLYDLPIALGYLLASEQTRFNPHSRLILGELALDGRLKPVKGALSFAFLAQEKGFEEILLPKENVQEASLLGVISQRKSPKVIGVESLKEVLAYLEGRKEIAETKINFDDLKARPGDFEIEFDWIKGQAHAKRGLEIAATGAHNLFLQGPPGAGKTLLAKAIISILPKLSAGELLELTKIYSAVGLFSKEWPFLVQRPFRSPHHTSSEAALIGGGSPPRPGEITLSHRGVLFMDEFPEFHRDALESLRQPLEEGKITIQRAKHTLTFPAKFTLIAAANPCPCGYWNDPERECTCSSSQVSSYRRKLSGPLMDRIDIFSWVPSLKYEELISPTEESQASQIRKRIEKARDIQKERFTPLEINDAKKDHTTKVSLTGFKEDNILPHTTPPAGNETTQGLTNSEMTIPQIKKYCQIGFKAQNLLRKFVDSAKLSARGYHRVLKVARTIADLEEKKDISFENVSEALSYRLQENN